MSSQPQASPGEGEQDGAAPGQAPGGRLPDFLIMGHQKCGTTALHLMLQQHPQLFMPHEKEPMFFLPSAPLAEGQTRRRPQTLEAYRRLFEEAGPDQLAGEASPQYLRSPEAIAAIAAAIPAAKLICLLREPVSFVRSLHLQTVHSGIETETDLRAALALEAERREGRRIPSRSLLPGLQLMYASYTRYAEQLAELHAAFPPENVRVLIYEDFRKDNLATVTDLLGFLGVASDISFEAVETKPLKSVRHPRMHRLTGQLRRARRNPAIASLPERIANRVISSQLENTALRSRWRKVLYEPSTPIDDQLKLELRRRFKPQVVEVSEYLGRDLVAQWGYSDL